MLQSSTNLTMPLSLTYKQNCIAKAVMRFHFFYNRIYNVHADCVELILIYKYKMDRNVK